MKVFNLKISLISEFSSTPYCDVKEIAVIGFISLGIWQEQIGSCRGVANLSFWTRVHNSIIRKVSIHDGIARYFMDSAVQEISYFCTCEMEYLQ